MWGRCRCKWQKPREYQKFLRFLIVGGIGFGIDAALLWGLVGMGVPPLLARLVSAGIAIGICWLINRRFTFAADTAPGLREGGKYYAVYAAGFAINYAVYAVALHGPFEFLGLQLEALLALACGSGAALLFHYAALRFWVYRQ